MTASNFHITYILNKHVCTLINFLHKLIKNINFFLNGVSTILKATLLCMISVSLLAQVPFEKGSLKSPEKYHIIFELCLCRIKCVSDNWRFWLELVFLDNWRLRLSLPCVRQLTCRIFDCLIMFVMIIDVVPKTDALQQETTLQKHLEVTKFYKSSLKSFVIFEPVL